MIRPLVISAAPFEAQSLLEELKKRELAVDYISCGIGAIHAARCVEKLKTSCENRDVIFIGSCGSFGPFHQPRLTRASTVLWLPACERTGLAWAIEDIDTPFPCPPCPAWAEQLPPVTVLCGPTIAKSDHIVEEVRMKIDTRMAPTLVENLELYSVAEPICTHARSFVAILGITNALCEQGRNQWRQNFKEVASMTAQFVSTQITGQALAGCQY